MLRHSNHCLERCHCSIASLVKRLDLLWNALFINLDDESLVLDIALYIVYKCFIYSEQNVIGTAMHETDLKLPLDLEGMELRQLIVVLLDLG